MFVFQTFDGIVKVIMAKLRDYKRVVGISELFFLAGRGLKRQGIKYTTLAAALGAGLIITNIIGRRVFGYDIPVSNVKALLIPTIIAILTFGVGNTLTGLSRLFSSQKILMADANAMNLLEDRKKARMTTHLETLWERVFKYEAQLLHGNCSEEETEKIRKQRHELRQKVRSWPGKLKDHFGIYEDNLDEFVSHVAWFRPFCVRLEASREGFVVSAGHSLRNPLPQKLERSLSGCDLSLLEDWYDGAYFTANDCKLKEQFAANRTIRGIRRQVGIPWAAQVKESMLGCPNPLWHSLTMKKMGMYVGGLIDRMNRRYVRNNEPTYFDAQDFLWKEAEADRLILRRFPENGPEVMRDLQESRKKMIRSIFSPRRQEAHNQIYRMFGRDFINALELRLKYDVEFAAGLLDYDPQGDLRQLREIMSCPVYSLGKTEAQVQRAKISLKTVDAFLKNYLPVVWQRPLELRAARIGFYLNRFKIQKWIHKNSGKATGIFNDNIIRAEKRYSQRICLLRQHYELCRIQLFAYVEMVDELGEYVR